MIERLSKMSCIERTSNLSRASLRRSRYLTFLPIYAILSDSTNAMNGSSKPRNFYRELPDGVRQRKEAAELVREQPVERSVLNTRVDRAGHPPLQDDEEHTDFV